MSAKPTRADDAPTANDTPNDAQFDAAAEIAREAIRHERGEFETEAGYLLPDAHVPDDTLAETLTVFMSSRMLRTITAAQEPDAEDVDGAAPGDDAPRTERTFLFNRDADETDLAFEVVTGYENRYGDRRVAVETPAPWDVPEGHDGDDPNEVIKSLPWGEDDAQDADDYDADDGAYYTFDADERPAPADTWVLDERALDDLRERATENGYAFEDSRNGEADDVNETLGDLLTFVEAGDRVTVRYLKKTNGEPNEYAGEVEAHATVRTDTTGGYEMTTGETWGLVFRDEGGKVKRVKPDDDGDVSMFSNGHYPFMGAVVGVTVEPAGE